MLTHLRHLARNERGASMVEFSIIASLFFMLLGGLIDFSYAFYQWNSATKALQQGARLAATSDPVDSSLKNWQGMDGGAAPGDPFPAFTRTCSGASGSCSGGTYSSTAMNTIVYGRGQTSCGAVGADQTPGMCDVFSRVQPQNVIVTYQQTGLGFAGRPGGPVPTITVELTGLTFNYVFLGGLFGPITMPPMRTTETGEDMCTNAPSNDPAAPCP
jgi:Flp pilus assembly protein TadG